MQSRSISLSSNYIRSSFLLDLLDPRITGSASFIMASHSVLFVCLGNICRSPIAEAIFRKLLADKDGLGQWEVRLSESFYKFDSFPGHLHCDLQPG